MKKYMTVLAVCLSIGLPLKSARADWYTVQDSSEDTYTGTADGNYSGTDYSAALLETALAPSSGTGGPLVSVHPSNDHVITVSPISQSITLLDTWDWDDSYQLPGDATIYYGLAPEKYEMEYFTSGSALDTSGSANTAVSTSNNSGVNFSDSGTGLYNIPSSWFGASNGTEFAGADTITTTTHFNYTSTFPAALTHDNSMTYDFGFICSLRVDAISGS